MPIALQRGRNGVSPRARLAQVAPPSETSMIRPFNLEGSGNRYPIITSEPGRVDLAASRAGGWTRMTEADTTELSLSLKCRRVNR